MVGKRLPEYDLSIVFVFVGKATGHTISFDKFLEQLLLMILVAMENPNLC